MLLHSKHLKKVYKLPIFNKFEIGLNKYKYIYKMTTTETQKENMKKYYLKNKEQISLRKMLWHLKNK